MKNKILIFMVAGLLFSSCNKLDLNPLSEGSSANWYSNNEELRMSLDYLYNSRFWNPNPDPLNFGNCAWLDSFTDNWTNRNIVGPLASGTVTGETDFIIAWWGYHYQCIAAANLLLVKIEDNKSNITEAKYNQYTAEARFVRAAQYSKLIFHWGDVPYSETVLGIDEAFALGRTPKADILQKIYADFDYAASLLPTAYGSSTAYATKGAALALKARIALFMGDMATASDAAKACMDLNVYQLYPDFATLFLSKTKHSVETVFGLPRSIAFNIFTPKGVTIQPLSRNTSGNDYVQPSWDLFNAFLCKDGLPIDESPLYNPQKPFLNRDPRCKATIVEFGTEFCGIIYQPHPDSILTTRLATGARISNLDCRAVTQYGSYNGLAWRKSIDSDWWDDQLTDPDIIVIRYADVMLMYAEAKIELGQIDQSVLDAINQVRARAYGVAYTNTTAYPSVTTTNQAALRKILRTERRMEFAFEGTRYDDIIRWKVAEKVLNTTIYGMIDPPEQRTKIVKTGLWFFPEVVPIDEDGVSDFASMFNKGYVKILGLRAFDKTKNYLWPIPTKEVLINKNLTQNPGY